MQERKNYIVRIYNIENGGKVKLVLARSFDSRKECEWLIDEEMRTATHTHHIEIEEEVYNFIPEDMYGFPNKQVLKKTIDYYYEW